MEEDDNKFFVKYVFTFVFFFTSILCPERAVTLTSLTYV